MLKDDAAVIRFGLFELDLKTGELRKKGLRVPLQEQPFKVLATLVEHPGELVTRDYLRARLWPEAVFVDFDHGLNKAIAKIRRALGDIAGSPQYVETLERRGYRFLAAVEPAVSPRAPGRPPGAAPVKARLVWAERTICLAAGDNLIGRDADALVWIDSLEVSRRHARIVMTDGCALLEDLGSKNGTYRNDWRLEAPALLSDGDVIRIGPALITYRDAPTSEATKTAVR